MLCLRCAHAVPMLWLRCADTKSSCCGASTGMLGARKRRRRGRRSGRQTTATWSGRCERLWVVVACWVWQGKARQARVAGLWQGANTLHAAQWAAAPTGAPLARSVHARRHRPTGAPSPCRAWSRTPSFGSSGLRTPPARRGRASCLQTAAWATFGSCAKRMRPTSDGLPHAYECCAALCTPLCWVAAACKVCSDQWDGRRGHLRASRWAALHVASGAPVQRRGYGVSHRVAISKGKTPRQTGMACMRPAASHSRSSSPSSSLLLPLLLSSLLSLPPSLPPLPLLPPAACRRGRSCSHSCAASGLASQAASKPLYVATSARTDRQNGPRVQATCEVRRCGCPRSRRRWRTNAMRGPTVHRLDLSCVPRLRDNSISAAGSAGEWAEGRQALVVCRFWDWAIGTNNPGINTVTCSCLVLRKACELAGTAPVLACS